jgi:hypothetical protein
MNLKIKDGTYIANGGKVTYWSIAEIYVRGNNIASLSFQEDLLDRLEAEKESNIPRGKLKLTYRDN